MIPAFSTRGGVKPEERRAPGKSIVEKAGNGIQLNIVQVHFLGFTFVMNKRIKLASSP